MREEYTFVFSGQTIYEVMSMAKQGMKRPERTHTRPRNEMPPVPQIQGKARSGQERAKPIIAGSEGGDLKVYHELKGDGSVGDPKG